MSTSGEEIKVLLTADLAQLQAGMEEGAATVTAATEQMQASVAQEAAAFNAAVQAKIDAQVRLNTAFASGITSTEGIAEAEAALDEAMAAGAVTATEYATYVGRLDAAEVELAASTAAATTATEANTVAMQINGGVAREIGVLVGELARGNYTRLEGSTITLANRTGFLTTALNALLSPLGLLAIAVAAVGLEVFEAGQKFEAMEGTVLATGEAAGYTAGQLMGMADEIGQSSGNIGLATEAIQKLAESGRFAGQDLRLVGQAATDMAILTGESIQSAVSQIEKLQEDPVKAVAKLNDQYHFLTLAQFKEIEAAQASGDSMRAASIAYEAMADKMQGRTDELNAHANVLIRSWRELKTVFSESMTEMNHALGGGDDAYGLNEAKLLLQTLEKQKKQAEEMGSSALPGINAQIAVQQKVVAQLTAEFDKQAKAAASVGQAAQESAAQIDAMAKGHAGKAGGSGSLEKDLRDQEAAQKISYDKRAQFEMEYWGEILQTAKVGSAEYALAWKNTQSLQKQLDDAQLADWKKNQSEVASEARKSAQAAIEAHRKAAQEETVSFEMQRLGTAANTAGRIQADAAILASATRLYGAMSSQQEAALRQMLADEKSYSAAYIKDQEAMEAKIEADHKRNADAIVKAQKDAAAKATAAWKGYLDPINHAFQQSIQGMIQGTQTLRQMTANLLQSILASYVQAGLNELEHHIVTQQAKTAATAAGAAERATIEAGAAAQSKAADAATGKSQIGTAAATGAAKAYQAIVGIPYVGPVLAPIAAGVAFAGIEAFSGMIASARGGWERVPFDGAMTELHKDEMVLPAHVAEPMRQMAKRGGQSGGGDGMTVYLNTTDARSWSDQLRRDPKALANALKIAHRRGHFGGS